MPTMHRRIAERWRHQDEHAGRPSSARAGPLESDRTMIASGVARVPSLPGAMIALPVAASFRLSKTPRHSVYAVSPGGAEPSCSPSGCRRRRPHQRVSAR